MLSSIVPFGASTRYVVMTLSAALLLTSAPLRAATEREYMARALGYEDTGDTAAALIEYKNVLKLDPHNQAARVRMGRMQLRVGNTRGAQNNLEQALEAGVDPAAVMLDLGRAYLQNGEFQRVLEVVRPEQATTRSEQARALVMRGYAGAGLGDSEGARGSFLQALKLAPHHSGALAGLGQLALQSGETDQIRGALAQDWGDQSDDPLVWRLRGALESAAGRYEAAARMFHAALTLQPGDPQSQLGIAYARIAQRRFDEALPWVEKVLAARPSNPRANLALAKIAVGQGRLEAALDPLRKVLLVTPESHEATLSLAAVNYDLGHNEQAHTLLKKFLASAPDYLPAHKLLAMVRMNMGVTDRTLWGLEPLLALHPRDPQLLVLAVKAAILADRPAQARIYIAQALELSIPPSLRPRLEQAEAVLFSPNGDYEAVVPLLDTVVSDYSQAMLRQALAKAVQSLKAGKPDEVKAHALVLQGTRDARLARDYLLGWAALAEGDRKAFRENMEQIVETAPDNVSAWNALGRLDLAEGHWREARAAFQKALEHDEGNYDAMIGMTRAQAAAGHPEKAIQWLERLRASYPDAPVPRFELAWTYLRQGRLDLAEAIMGELRQLLPDSPLLLDLRGAMYAARGDYPAALAELRKAAAALPESTRILLRLAWVQEKTMDQKRARESYSKVLRLQPGNALAAAHLVRLELDAKRYRQARQVAEGLRQADPVAATILEADIYRAQGKAQQAREAYHQALSLAATLAEARRYAIGGAVAASLDTLGGSREQRRLDLEALRQVAPGHRRVIDLEGQLAMQEGDYQAAADIYENARGRSPRQVLWILRLGQAMEAAGHIPEALDLLQGWLKEHPSAIQVRLLVARQLLRTGRQAEALDQYAKVIEVDPDNIIALNNTAWVSADERPAQALAYARKAAKLHPSANILQTLGVVLLRNDEAQEALKVLREASSKDPANLDIRYDLAVALERNGRRREAEQLANALLADPKPFKNREKARALLQAMKDG